jgi:hypothetical protein
MMKVHRIAVLTVFLLILSAMPAFGQICQTAQYMNKLACEPTRTAAAGFAAYEANSATPAGATQVYHLTTAVQFAVPLGIGPSYASQIGSAPSPSPSAGYVVTVHGGKATVAFTGGAISVGETQKTYTTGSRDAGPLFSDIPQTLDRWNLYLGVSFQDMNFTKIGGEPIGALPFSLAATDNYFLNKGTGNTGWQGSFPVTGNASLKIYTSNIYLAFGLPGRIELSTVIPIIQASFGFNTSCVSSGSLTFLGTSYCSNYAYTNVQNDTTRNPTTGWYEYWVYGPATTLANPLSAGRLGDVTVSSKWNFFIKKLRAQDGSERANQGMALGVEYRMPTGDPLNFQGSGAIGIRPSLTYGYNGALKGHLSPHINVGFQYNGKSINDIRDTANYSSSTGYTYSNVLTPSKLPNVLIGSAGVDLALKNWINIDADVLGRKFSNDGSSAFTASLFGNTLTPGFHGAAYKETLVTGVKLFLPGDKLRMSFAGFVTMDMNPNAGMSYNPAPSFSFAYEFGKKAL